MNAMDSVLLKAGRACNICGGPARLTAAGSPSLVRCSACGLTSLAAFPPADELDAPYQEDYYSAGRGERFLSIFERAVWLFRKMRLRSILRREPGPGAILDVGCGRGDLLQLFKEAGWRAVGTQVSRTAARAARESRGVDVLCGELPDLPLEPASFQVITFFHVLEHLPRPGEYLRAARELLADDGLLVVEVPDCSSPSFRLLPLRNFCLDYPHHLVFFTPASLRGLLEECGFRVVGSSGFSLEYSPYTTLQNLLNLLPGQPSRLYRSFMMNAAGRALRRSPLTWLHALLAIPLAPAALLISALALAFPVGNTLRLYCRKSGIPEGS